MTVTAFAGPHRIASGDLVAVSAAVQARLAQGDSLPVLVFDDATGSQIDLDPRGTRPAAEPTPRGPGRPRLGVVAREVTLLPRHWEWLAAQPGGTSVALRKLVDAARRADDGPARIRAAKEGAYRFATAIAGDLPGYEAAMRSLFAGDGERLAVECADWPKDIRDHVLALAAPAVAASD